MPRGRPRPVRAAALRRRHRRRSSAALRARQGVVHVGVRRGGQLVRARRAIAGRMDARGANSPHAARTLGAPRAGPALTATRGVAAPALMLSALLATALLLSACGDRSGAPAATPRAARTQAATPAAALKDRPHT